MAVVRETKILFMTQTLPMETLKGSELLWYFRSTIRFIPARSLINVLVVVSLSYYKRILTISTPPWILLANCAKIKKDVPHGQGKASHHGLNLHPYKI